MAKPRNRVPTPDNPVSFGYKIAWFAVRTDDMEAVARALHMTALTPSTWVEGINAAYEAGAFVTEPVKGWVLVPSWQWFRVLGDEPGKVIGPGLRKLSTVLGHVQFFATYRVSEYHIWADAKSGKVRRGYGFIGERGETVWNQGRATAAELGVGPFTQVGVAEGERWPTEESVMQIAARWSVNPSELTEMALEPSLGIRCTPPARLPT